MMRTASIRLDVDGEQAARLSELRSEYADACNRLVPIVQANRCWNRVALHRLTYTFLRNETLLGAQMVCNAIFSVCKAYRSQVLLGRVSPDSPVPALHFRHSSVHFDHRTYTLKGERLSLNTLQGRIHVSLEVAERQLAILRMGVPKEAELFYRRGVWFFNIAVESPDGAAVADGPTVGIDIGETTLAASSTGRIWGGEALRHWRGCHLALRRRLQSNGSQSALQRLRQVSGKEMRRIKQINHETSKAIIAEAQRIGASRIIMEDLTHIRDRIRTSRRMRARLHGWAFRQLQTFIWYKAIAVGISVEYVNPAYTSQTCSECGRIGSRVKHRFECSCGLRAHADLNASRNLARIGETAVSPRAAVGTPHVGCVGHHASP